MWTGTSSLSLRDIPGVEDVEPYNSANVLYKLRPEDEWRQGVIQMRDNYEQQKYELLQLRDGYWPHYKNEIAVERMGAQFLNIGIGDSVIFKIDEKERVLPITGFHPPSLCAAASVYGSGILLHEWRGHGAPGNSAGQVRWVLCACDALQ